IVWHSETTSSDINEFEYSDVKFNNVRIFADYIEIYNAKSDCKKVGIYNILGNEVLSEFINSNAINVNVINISRLQAGVYFLKVKNKVFKFLKK
ncbi:MAG: T9SS type A sorting domain-containing protein, partial [Ignavibacteria bacterium]|nr:T9SS type A sorting domain-containing protein [Ignavibacteria bacterium]